MSYYDPELNIARESEELLERRLRIRLLESNFPTLYLKNEIQDYPELGKKLSKFFSLESKNSLLVRGKQSVDVGYTTFKRYVRNYPQNKCKTFTFNELYSIIVSSWTDSESFQTYQSLKKIDCLYISSLGIPLNRENNNTVRLQELLQYRQNFQKLTIYSITTFKASELIEYYKLIPETISSLEY